ncbi:MAG: hypothetical protein HXS41_13115 [Theionarchaea archaeon]|nr:hypothetical protein [Theionarchaea archaeon]MBU7000624.1 hypothetical protein [Theionarchaea archaeon]MBU7021993.1 hypothetical protein [Theionarchaea archaeon]MBU7036088.1 hypothetical protein [Theionarchaea archaeon]MBU7041678.1 hypothetical protein [Theionarchaea archaeon]
MIPVTSLLQMTDLIQEGSVEIQIGESSIMVERDVITVDLCGLEDSLLIYRQDMLPQLRQLSELFSDAGKTLVIKYEHSRMLKLGAHTDSVFLRLIGLDRVAIRNPVTVYRFLRKTRKGELYYPLLREGCT